LVAVVLMLETLELMLETAELRPETVELRAEYSCCSSLTFVLSWLAS